jgi:hypothetical protein
VDNHKFIFIGGLHRSGTWLLTHCLENHPLISRLAGPGVEGISEADSKYEGQFLQTVYPSDDYYGGVGRLGFHPDVHLTEQSPLITQENRDKLRAEWMRYWDSSKPFFLEKTPANLVRSRFLQAMFPASYFIFMMRHPVAVALAQQKWTGTSLYSLIEHWLVCYETLRNDFGHLERSLLTRYESFVSNPLAQMKRTYSFLGIEPNGMEQKVRSDGNEKYFRVWRGAMEGRALGGSTMRRVLKRLSPYCIQAGYPLTILANEVDCIIKRFETRVNSFGYSLTDLAFVNEAPMAVATSKTPTTP